jgi:DNA-binding NarL/FixJ family response regulator
LALVDVNMPGMSGIELTEEIKKSSPETTVIIVTGEATRSDIISSYRYGSHSYIRKPFEPEKLITYLSTLESIIDEKRIERKLRLKKENRPFTVRYAEKLYQSFSRLFLEKAKRPLQLCAMVIIVSFFTLLLGYALSS